MTDERRSSKTRGSTGTVLFILFALGYVGFELYAVSRVGYRAEPDYIFRNHAAASHAVEVCGALKSGPSEKFRANYSYVRQRAIDAFAKAGDDESSAEAKVLEMELATQRELDALIDETSCADKAVWTHRKRYEIYTRSNLPGT